MLFPTLPPTARVWLFEADRDIPEALFAAVRRWLPTWTSHARPVTAEADVLAGRVLAVAALISPEDLNAGVSGCGIDAMTHAVEQAFAEADCTLAPALAVTHRDADGAWQTVPRPTFRRLAREGGVSGDTPVLDLTATDLGTLRETGVERPAAESWHGRVFRLGTEAGGLAA